MSKLSRPRHIFYACIVHGPGDVDRFDTLPMDLTVADQVLEAAKVECRRHERKMCEETMQYYIECSHVFHYDHVVTKERMQETAALDKQVAAEDAEAKESSAVADGCAVDELLSGRESLVEASEGSVAPVGEPEVSVEAQKASAAPVESPAEAGDGPDRVSDAPLPKPSGKSKGGGKGKPKAKAKAKAKVECRVDAGATTTNPEDPVDPLPKPECIVSLNAVSPQQQMKAVRGKGKNKQKGGKKDDVDVPMPDAMDNDAKDAKKDKRPPGRPKSKPGPKAKAKPADAKPAPKASAKAKAKATTKAKAKASAKRIEPSQPLAGNDEGAPRHTRRGKELLCAEVEESRKKKSRQSCAYHKAKKEAEAQGLSEEEAKQKARAVSSLILLDLHVSVQVCLACTGFCNVRLTKAPHDAIRYDDDK